MKNTVTFLSRFAKTQQHSLRYCYSLAKNTNQYVQNTLSKNKNRMMLNKMMFRFGNECKNNPGKQCQNGQGCSNHGQGSTCSNHGSCSNSEGKEPLKVPEENLQIKHEEMKLGEQMMDCYETKGAISILNHEIIKNIPGTKLTETGQLYALMFTCGQCNTRAIKSFTKNAYHKGVVLIRCDGCDAVHLVADNLGWFEDEAKNLDSYSKQGEQVKKVYDPVAVVQFLKAAFGKDHKNQQTCTEIPQSTFEENKKKQ